MLKKDTFILHIAFIKKLYFFRELQRDNLSSHYHFTGLASNILVCFLCSIFGLDICYTNTCEVPDLVVTQSLPVCFIVSYTQMSH